MRPNGFAERLISGDADDYEKFAAQWKQRLIAMNLHNPSTARWDSS